jgi:hypothetical protein
MPTSNNTFPQEIEVTLKFKVKVNTQDARDYFLNSETEDSAAVSFLADTFDSWFDIENSCLVSINDVSAEKVKQALNAAAGM